MSYLPTAITLLGPAAVFTGAAAVLLPPKVLARPRTDTTPAKYLKTNDVLGPLLIAIVLSVAMLTPGPWNPNGFLEVIYLLGGFVAIGTTLVALATCIGALWWRIATRKSRKAERARTQTRTRES